MKRYIFVALFMSLSLFCRAEQQVVLDLNGGVTWMKIFEAGFRPVHLSGGEFMCTQYDVDLSIRGISGELLNLGKGDVDFSVKEGGLLVLMSFYGRENRSLEEARRKSNSFVEMLGGHVTQQAALDTFRVKHDVGYGGQKIDPPEIEEHVDLKTTTNAARIDEFSVIYSFGDSYFDDFPLVERLTVALKSQEAKRAKRLTEKIRPPAGYEHVSLESMQDSAGPDSETTAPNIEREDGDVEVSRPEEERKVAEDDTVTENRNHLLWIIGGVLLLGVVGILVRAFKRGRAS